MITPASKPVLPVLDETAEELRLIVGSFADEIRGRLACSPDVAVSTTLGAVQMALVTWRIDVTETPYHVTEPKDRAA